MAFRRDRSAHESAGARPLEVPEHPAAMSCRPGSGGTRRQAPRPPHGRANTRDKLRGARTSARVLEISDPVATTGYHASHPLQTAPRQLHRVVGQPASCSSCSPAMPAAPCPTQQRDLPPRWYATPDLPSTSDTGARYEQPIPGRRIPAAAEGAPLQELPATRLAEERGVPQPLAGKALAASRRPCNED